MSFCGGGVRGVRWFAQHSHFHVQPNYSVEVVLCWGWGCDNLKLIVLLFVKLLPIRLSLTVVQFILLIPMMCEFEFS